MTTRRIAILLGLLCFAVSSDTQAADPPKPVKVFILAGQSNMEGQAVSDLAGKDYNDGKGTLVALLKDPAKAALVKHLQTERASGRCGTTFGSGTSARSNPFSPAR